MRERVLGFVFDDVNEEKLAAHGISVRQVEQILDEVHIVARNRANRRGPILVIGRDAGGACIAVPAEAAYDKGYWRPITAWYCKGPETQALRRVERR